MDENGYIHVGALIDGSGGPIQHEVLLTVAAGRISRIEPFHRSRLADPARLVDLSGCTIIPPLVDSHVHLALSGTVDMAIRARQLVADYPAAVATITANLADHFAHGILALRDGGDQFGHVRRYQELTAGESLPVRLHVSGRAWHRQGRYGRMLGRHPNPGEALAAALARESEPTDQLKLINSGPNSLQEFARQTPPQFTLVELRQAVRLAHGRGQTVMVHANGVEPVRLAIEAGADSIEHGYFMGRENLERLAARQICWVPTLFAMQVCAAGPRSAGEREIAARNVESQLRQVALAKALGVVIAAGTDAGCHGVRHGEALAEELKMLLRGGLSLPEVIRAASHAGARLLGFPDLGWIAPGRAADFLVIPGAPAQLPAKLADLAAIYLKGRPTSGPGNGAPTSAPA